MHCQNGTSGVLISAALAARRARDHELEKEIQDPCMVQFFKTILDHAFLLPLMELKLNQCTSFQGCQILTQQNLAQPYCFGSVAPLFFGEKFISLELTPIGENEFEQAFLELPYGRHLAYFGELLSAYSCVDYGTGICGTQTFIEHAIQSSDIPLLERIVDAETGENHFFAAKIEESFAGLDTMSNAAFRSITRGPVVDLPNKRKL